LLLGSSRQYGTLSPAVETHLVERMVRRALDFVPGLQHLDALRLWTGFRAATPDHLPILGPVPGHPRLLLATGHEGLGITTSLGSARLIANQLLGRRSEIDPAPFRADRLASTAATPPEVAVHA
jgi:glycine/D-amino acid oxidase-like deaminating enzyme